MAKPYKDGKGWCIRKRYAGEEIFFSGRKSASEARTAMDAEIAARKRCGKPKHLGPHRTTLAQALQDFGLEHLRRLKGAEQEARRINKYLQAAGIEMLAVGPAAENSNLHHDVWLLPIDTQRRIPQGLTRHRKALLCKTAGSDRLRQILAQTTVAKITTAQIQALMDALLADGLSPATVALERALLRGFFNKARKGWGWSAPEVNPAKELELPAIDNVRDRVLSLKEQTLLEEAFGSAHNERLRHVVVLLRETAMRASEPLLHATWNAVDWERKVLKLSDGKEGRRDVPLSPKAIETLKALGPGAPEESIVELTYEALKAGFRRCCERAGIEDLHLHDLRHTAATRLAIETGNVFLVKALTGHKTDVMVHRYVNVKADDVVRHFHRKGVQVSAEESTQVQTPDDGCSPSPVALPGLLDPERMQALVSQAVSDAMAKALQDARVPTPTPTPSPAPEIFAAGNVVAFARAA